MNIRHVSRSRDDQILRLLRWRSDGKTPREIAEHFGITAANVRATTDTILHDDLRNGGDPRREIEAGYWR